MQSIGERLEEARKRKGVSIREAAEATKIRGDYLQKLETNKFDLGLTPLYVRGFLRNYAHWLKLPADKLVSDFDSLGLDSPRTARPINREVYGRMELSAAGKSTDELPGEPAPAAALRPAAPGPGRARRPSSVSPRATAEPTSNTPALLQLGALVAGVVLVLILGVWGFRVLFGHGRTPVPTSTPTATVTPSLPPTPAPTPAMLITAVEPVTLQVWEENADHSYGKVLLAPTPLAAGQSQTVPKTGPVYIQASAAEKITIDMAGKRTLPAAYGFKGDQAFELR